MVDREDQGAEQIRGLLLVGGRSTRMGRDKAFLADSTGQTLLQRGLDRLSSVCSSVAVSARRDQVEQLRGRLPVECGIIVDQLLDAGPASALLAAHTSDPSASWLAFAVDFPLTPLAAFETLASAHDRSALATCYENGDGFIEPLFGIWTPLLLDRLAEQVATGNTSPSFAIRTARKLASDRINVLKPKDASWLFNANTPEDFGAALAQRRHAPSVTFASAQERVVELGRRLAIDAKETVRVGDAVGRIVATRVNSPMALPPFRNSAMDGVVVRFSEVTSLPVVLKRVGTIAAGDAVPQGKAERGSCYEIMTGAPLPEDVSFDTVIRNEDYAAPSEAGSIELGKPVRPGQDVRLAGEDVRTGRVLLDEGVVMRAAHVGVLAAAGVTEVEVRPKLRVGIIATGSELVASGQLGSGQIYNSNGPTLAAFMVAGGHEAITLPAVADDLDTFCALLSTLPPLDALVVTGGISAGKFDFVPDALARLGAHFFFRSVAMRPGHPCHVALLYDRLPFFALPGNPLAALACYRFIVDAHLRARLGREPERPLRARLAGEQASTKPTAAFVVRTGIHDGYEGTVRVLHGQQGAGSVGSLIDANVWVALPVGVDAVNIGTEVDICPMS